MSRSRLSWLLALLLVLQSGLAAAHCLGRVGGGGEAVTICTPAGLRSVVLPATGDEPAATTPDGFCAACHALPTVMLPAAPMLSAPAWARASPATEPRAAAAPRPRARDPSGGPRGPPIPT